MKQRSHRSLALLAASSLLLPCAAAAPSGANLLTNPSFESGMNAWTITSTSAAGVESYGAPLLPSQFLGNHIGGGNRMLRDLGGNARVEQIISLAGIAPGDGLHVGGYFGGGPAGGSRAVFRFLDGSGAEIALRPLPVVSNLTRNFEWALLLQEGILDIPAGATDLAVRIEFQWVGFNVVTGAVDALFVKAVASPTLPPPHALDAELIVNGAFEDGFAFGSPLTPNDSQGWTCVGGAASVVRPYSDSDSQVPSTVVSCLIGGGNQNTSCLPGGGGNLLVGTSSGGVLRQRVDLRGNQTQFATPGSVALHVSSFLGGSLGAPDFARIDVRFLDASFTPISPLPPLGPVTRENRNEQTVVLKRELEYFIPSSTCYVEIDCVLVRAGFGATVCQLDNVSAKLVVPTPPAPVAKDVNLLSNASFESGDLPGSALQLTNTNGWFGLANRHVVHAYGQNGLVPTIAFSQAEGLGGLLLGHLGSNILRHNIDLRGDQLQVANGELFVHAVALLGGALAEPDTAELRIRFVNAAGGQVGGLGGLQILGPVTAAERGNLTTLLKREAEFLVPPNTDHIEVEIRFVDAGFGGSLGLADGLQLVISDSTDPGSGFCFGDGSGAACPCGNSGALGSGCVNSSGHAAHLRGVGDALVGADNVVLLADGCPANTPGLFFSGNSALWGSPFGDGLRCVGGPIVRLGTSFTDASGAAQSQVALSVAEGLSGGELRNYQFWFRDIGGTCGSGFNTTNGYSIQW